MTALTILIVILGIVATVSVLAFAMLFYYVARAIKQARDITIKEMRRDKEQQEKMREYNKRIEDDK